MINYHVDEGKDSNNTSGFRLPRCHKQPIALMLWSYNTSNLQEILTMTINLNEGEDFPITLLVCDPPCCWNAANRFDALVP